MYKLFLIIIVLSLAYSLKAKSDDQEKTTIHFQSDVESILTPKLAYYYGSKVLLLDSITIEEQRTLSYSSDLHKGIYLLVFSDSEVYEFLINDQKELQIKITFEDNSYHCTIHGDSISGAFDTYNKKMEEILNLTDSLKKGDL
jgi:hypothetical protein